jgi:hypothetical protein
MPVEAHDGRIVLERVIGRLNNGVDEVLHSFSRVHLRPRGHDRGDVDQRRCGRACRR